MWGGSHFKACSIGIVRAISSHTSDGTGGEDSAIEADETFLSDAEHDEEMMPFSDKMSGSGNEDFDMGTDITLDDAEPEQFDIGTVTDDNTPLSFTDRNVGDEDGHIDEDYSMDSDKERAGDDFDEIKMADYVDVGAHVDAEKMKVQGVSMMFNPFDTAQDDESDTVYDILDPLNFIE